LSSACDEENAGENGPGEQTQQPITLHWTCPSCSQNNVEHIYWGPQRKEGQWSVTHKWRLHFT
jgi:hypothetical protein